ncbi:MAG: HEAT repeat domain-containing protein [Spirosomataceae bacterium]
MKKISNILIVLFLSSHLSTAQTTEERITSVLQQFPAQNAKQLQKNIEGMAALGQSGIAQLATLLDNATQEQLTQIQYAVGGFSYFVTQNNKEDWRKIAAQAYTEALQKVMNKEQKAFLIFQLQQVGKDEVVGTLSTFLADEKLSGPAARALGKIGTPLAGKTLTQALYGASETRKIALVEALGDARFAEAASALEPLATSPHIDLRKVTLYALANIGVPSSEKILLSAATKVAYNYDQANATASYLIFLNRLIENGHKILALKAADALHKSTPSTQQIPTHIAALKLLTDIQAGASMPILLKAMESSEVSYRAAALKFAQKYINPTTINLWIKALPKAKPEVQAEIIE